ncbi:uncharacterized protein si:ch211-110p13.9 [Erpetoichthys calabaricus]|uniref:uncharacterized protein si:ch211-110p13.9 n=1 Tax=Erpetoichthys calabaricus TaxID=27687 RepID=UPI0010A03CFA|nr:uncharacterized protein si:ch211-110p13.9 [Erpetoichthys calabaricus]
MSSKVTTLQLPQWSTGLRSVRYLYLSDVNSFKLRVNGETQENIIPLFLGADIFSKTCIRTENHPRFHAKYAKKGLATRLNFSSNFRVQGLKMTSSSNSLWFYSIQGFFRVAFEIFSKEEQLSVLDTFQEVWKSRINDGLLSVSYNMSVQVDDPWASTCILHYQRDCSSNFTPEKVHKLSHCELSAQSYDMVDTPVSFTHIPSDHNYGKSEGYSVDTIVSPILQKIKRLEYSLQTLDATVMGQLTDTIVPLLECAEQLISKTINKEEVSDTVLQLLKTYCLSSVANDSSVYNNSLLFAVSSWLGQQFSAAHTCISKRIESFKLNHIDRITDLPPAEDLVSQLFPESMRVLLLNWMGLSDDAAIWKRHSEYPILLLILEFANHNLITGVAHVLYSSLICK